MSKHPHNLGWKIELGLATLFLLLALLWAAKSNAGEYQGTYHPAPKAEQVIKRQGMVLWRFIDGPVRCYWVVQDARMIGAQVSLSCVVPDKEKQQNVEPKPRAGG